MTVFAAGSQSGRTETLQCSKPHKPVWFVLAIITKWKINFSLCFFKKIKSSAFNCKEKYAATEGLTEETFQALKTMSEGVSMSEWMIMRNCITLQYIHISAQRKLTIIFSAWIKSHLLMPPTLNMMIQFKLEDYSVHPSVKSGFRTSEHRIKKRIRKK